MRLVLHLVWKDLRRLRFWLVAWLAVTALPLLVGARMMVQEPEREDWRWLEEAPGWLLGVRLLLGYLLTVLLVQEDRVVGTRAFWLTRPISSGRLLTAKLTAAVGIVAGGQALVYLPWWLWCGLGGAGVLANAADCIVMALAVIVPAMLVAALTDSLGRAVLWSFVMFVAVAMVPAFVPVMLRMTSGRQAEALVIYATLGAVVLLATMAAGVVLLYRNRRYSLGLAVVAAAGVGALVLARQVPAFWLRDGEPAEWRAERAAGVKVTFHEAAIARMAQTRGMVETLDHLWIGYAATNGPTDLVVGGFGARQQWRWPGVELRRDGQLYALGYSGVPPLFGFNLPEPDPVTMEWRQAESVRLRKTGARLGGRLTRPSEGTWLQSYVHVPASLGERMGREAPVYEGRLWLSLLRPTMVNEVAWSVGGWRRGDAHGMRVAWRQEGGRDQRVSVVDATPVRWWRDMTPQNRPQAWVMRGGDPGFVLLNRARGERVHLREESRRTLLVAGVRLTWRHLTTSGLEVRRGENWVPRPGWLDEASVAYVRVAQEAVFLREVKVDAFSVRRDEREE